MKNGKNASLLRSQQGIGLGFVDGATREREFGNLHNIKDNYPKYVVSMTPLVTRNDDNGITHLHLRNFLMLENLE